MSALPPPVSAVAQTFSLRYAPVLLAIWLAWPAFADYAEAPAVNGAGGGAASYGSTYSLTDTAGQPAIGPAATGGTYTLASGFWEVLGGGPETQNSGDTTWPAGGSLTWRLNDATGLAGDDPGWDLFNIIGNLTITATNKPDDSQKFTINLVTLSGSAAGAADHFTNTATNTWIIATASGAVSQFNAAKFILDTNGFKNELNGGTFSLVLIDKSVALVFAPTVAPCSVRTTAAFHQDGSEMHMQFENNSKLTSVQALVMVNCAITGTAYNLAGGILQSGLSVTANIRTTLPENTTRVELVAAKLATGPATVNVIALDTCGLGKSFDPVITQLKVTSGNLVEQRFTGLLAAEHYLQVINATPGLRWLEVTMNGSKFRLDPLSDGQTVSADLAAAMLEGDRNVVVLRGGGAVGASAYVLITDLPGANLITLTPMVELTMTPAADGMVVSWPEALVGWQLQASETLAVGWTDVPATPVVADGYQTVSVTKSNQQQFFRLRKASAAAPSAKATGGTLSTAETRQPPKRTYDGILW
jgi:hypothetical protein